MRESKSTYRTMHLLLAGACEVLEPNHQFQYNLILFRLFGNTVFGIEILFVVQPEICAEWYRKFDENQSIVTENLEEMKDVDPQMYEVLVRQNIHSLVVVPLYDDGKVIGFYGVDNPSTRYFEFVSEMLQIM